MQRLPRFHQARRRRVQLCAQSLLRRDARSPLLIQLLQRALQLRGTLPLGLRRDLPRAVLRRLQLLPQAVAACALLLQRLLCLRQLCAQPLLRRAARVLLLMQLLHRALQLRVHAGQVSTQMLCGCLVVMCHFTRVLLLCGQPVCQLQH